MLDSFLYKIYLVLSLDLLSIVIACVVLMYFVAKINNSYFRAELKLVLRMFGEGVYCFFSIFTRPFRQPPFMLWITSYPEWSRRFFVPDNYQNMKERYHSGGTTEYLPCMFLLYSKRFKWLIGVTGIVFFGLLFIVYGFNSGSNGLELLQRRFVVPFYVIFTVLVTGVWKPYTGFILVLSVLFLYLSDLCADPLNVSRIVSWVYSAKYSVPTYVSNFFAFLLGAVPIVINSNIKRVSKVLILVLFVFVFYNSVSITSLMVEFASAARENLGLLVFATLLTPLIIVPSIPAKEKEHLCNSKIACKCAARVQKEGEGRKRLVVQNVVILVSFLLFAVMLSVKVASLLSDDYLAAPLLRMSPVSELFNVIDFSTFPELWKKVFIDSKFNFVSSSLFLVMLCVVIRNTFFCYSNSCVGVGDNQLKHLRIINAFAIALLMCCFVYLMFSYNFEVYTLSLPGLFEGGRMVSLLMPIGLIMDVVIFLVVLLNLAILYKFVYCDNYVFSSHVLLPWITVVMAGLISVNSSTHIPKEFYLLVLAYVIAGIFFFVPQFFHTRDSTDCTRRLEYGLYLWPLGVRVWMFIFGFLISIPILLIKVKYALSFFVLVSFVFPWVMYSFLRSPILLNLWRGKDFYKSFIEGEVALTPFTKGSVCFWPIRCLPLLPSSTNYSGGQSPIASLYICIGLHELLTSKMKFHRSAGGELIYSKNFPFFLALKWFLFCCVPIWSSFLVLVFFTAYISAKTGGMYFFQQSLATFVIGKEYFLCRYIFLCCGALWFYLSFKMVSFELSRLNSLISYDKDNEGQAVVPLWVKSRAVRAQQDFSELFRTQTQSVLKITLGAFASVYCVLLTLG